MADFSKLKKISSVSSSSGDATCYEVCEKIDELIEICNELPENIKAEQYWTTAVMRLGEAKKCISYLTPLEGDGEEVEVEVEVEEETKSEEEDAEG